MNCELSTAKGILPEGGVAGATVNLLERLSRSARAHAVTTVTRRFRDDLVVLVPGRYWKLTPALCLLLGILICNELVDEAPEWVGVVIGHQIELADEEEPMLKRVVELGLRSLGLKVSEVVGVGVGVDSEHALVQLLHLGQVAGREAVVGNGSGVLRQNVGVGELLVAPLDELAHVVDGRQGTRCGMCLVGPMVRDVLAAAHARTSARIAHISEHRDQLDQLLEQRHSLGGDPLVPADAPGQLQELPEILVPERRGRLHVQLVNAAVLGHWHPLHRPRRAARGGHGDGGQGGGGRGLLGGRHLQKVWQVLA
mmetsp:Transcript_24244/g.81701  ORF Transcript_24244/g.81701 Transcript_24244/m.81701 type:complete len:311 (+) Transcript_24244:153-1085(+)